MIYNIRDFGAIADGKTMNTTAINNAIQACARNGGGRVVVPAGGVYMSGTIWMKSHVELHFEHGAVLKASGDFRDYCTADDYPQNYDVPSEQWVGAHLIVALECDDIAITGTGMIDGNVWVFIKPENTRHTGSPEYHYVWFKGLKIAPRPGQTIALVECKNVHVSDITLRDLPSWGLFMHGCDYVQVRGITVINDPDVCNTDGMDIDACRYVTVSDCLIDTGDDAIAIRNAGYRLKEKDRVCEYVTITNCVLASCSSVFRIGVGRGGVLKHMRISNITVHRGAVLVNFCTEYGKLSRSPMEDINFSNISATGVARFLTMATRTGVQVKNITLENIRCEMRGSSYIWTEVPGAIRDITLKDIDLFVTDDDVEPTEKVRGDRGEYVLDIKSIEGLELDRVRVSGSEKELERWSGVMRVQDCPDMIQKDCRL